QLESAPIEVRLQPPYRPFAALALHVEFAARQRPAAWLLALRITRSSVTATPRPSSAKMARSIGFVCRDSIQGPALPLCSASRNMVAGSLHPGTSPTESSAAIATTP